MPLLHADAPEIPVSPTDPAFFPFEPFRARCSRRFYERIGDHAARLGWDSERIRGFQTSRLRALLATAVARSPFHAERLRDVRPETARLEDLAAVPTMTKADLMARFDDVVTDRRITRELAERAIAATRDEPIVVHDGFLVLASGGSSGKRGIFVYDEEALVELNAAIVRPMMARMNAMGGPPTGGLDMALVAADSPIHATGSAPRLIAGGPIRFHRFPATMPAEEVASGVARVGPQLLYGYPSVLVRLARAQLEGRFDLRLRGVTCTSETLGPEMADVMRRAWNAPVVNQFGSSEGLTGASLPDDPAIVFASDCCIVEPVDEQDRPVAAGEPSAAVLLTNLYNHVQPLIRYRLDDRFFVLPSVGSGHLRARVEGRTSELLRYGSLTVHPLLITSELTRLPAVVDYRIRQTPGGAAIDLLVSEPVDTETIAARIAAVLQQAGIVDASVQVRRVDDLPRHAATGKVARVVALG